MINNISYTSIEGLASAYFNGFIWKSFQRKLENERY